jgi:DNA polymerase (family 10)
MNQYEAAAVLREIAALIELSDPLPQKSIAYRKAANALESIQNIQDYLQIEKLQSLPGIGPKIAEMILSLLQKEKLQYYEDLKKKVPSTLLELAFIPGLTLKKIRQLYQQMGIDNLDELKKHLEGEDIKKMAYPLLHQKFKKKDRIFYQRRTNSFITNSFRSW